MNRSALSGGACGDSEKGRGIEQAWFVVASDSNGGICALQFAEDRLAEVFGLCRARISAKERAADAQIEDYARGGTEIRIEDRPRAARLGTKPSLDLLALRHGGQTASIAKAIVSKSWMDGRQLPERLPSRTLRNRHVGVVGNEGLAVGGIRDADGEPHSDQRIEHGDLRLMERKNTVISGDDSAGRG